MTTSLTFLLSLIGSLFSFNPASQASTDPVVNDDFQQHITSALHYDNNIVLRNFDGTNSTIYIYKTSATLRNSDGTQCSIYFFGGNSLNLIALDGSSRTVYHHGASSTITDPRDGSQIFVNHSRTTSTCSQPDARHTINHTLNIGLQKSSSRRTPKGINVLIHHNWLMKKEIAKAVAEMEEK